MPENAMPENAIPERQPAPDFTRIGPQEAASLQGRDDVVFVDIRETEEYAALRLQSSRPQQVRLLPLSIIPYLPKVEDVEKTALFFCRSGRRTAANLARLEALGYSKNLILDMGLNGWQEEGLAVQTSRRPVSLPRQAQIAAGLLVILFVLIGRFGPAWATWLAALVGAGLIFAGASGFCGLALLLGRMPWNRRKE